MKVFPVHNCPQPPLLPFTLAVWTSLICNSFQCHKPQVCISHVTSVVISGKAARGIKGFGLPTRKVDKRFWLGLNEWSMSLGFERTIHIEVMFFYFYFFAYFKGFHNTEMPEVVNSHTHQKLKQSQNSVLLSCICIEITNSQFLEQMHSYPVWRISPFFWK